MTAPEAPRTRFWAWFAWNEERLRCGLATAPESAGALVDELADALQQYDTRLFPLIGASPEGDCELIVTAEGNRDAFPAVFELVRAAPPLAGWTFTALKPRFGDFDPLTSVSHEGITLSLESTRFALRAEDGKLDLALLVPDHAVEEAEAYAFAATQLVEGVLGEHDLATRVSTLRVFGRTAFRTATGHEGRPLAELVDAIPPGRP